MTPDALLRSRAEAMAAEYRAEFLRTGDALFAWGVADCLMEIELIEGMVTIETRNA